MKQRDQIIREAQEHVDFARELEQQAQAQAAAAPADDAVARWREDGERRERAHAAAREERAHVEREEQRSQQQQFEECSTI